MQELRMKRCIYYVKRGGVYFHFLPFLLNPCSKACPTEEQEGFSAADVPWTGATREEN